jgi:UDP-N-acetylmuramate--alanine ligase
MTLPLEPDQIDLLLRAAGRGSLVYLVGAGGCGMSGLGHLLLDLGHQVAGSDLVANEETRQLQERGARISSQHLGQAVRTARPVLVAHTPAVGPGNPELAAARELGIPVVRRGVLLAALLHRQRGICVAGMHGKTTTTALLAFALENLAARPSYAVGALLPQLPRSARFSETSANPQPWLVVETDESDGTLRCFQPEHAILLNLDLEHLDHFKDLAAVCGEFGSFSGRVRGLRIYCKDDPELCHMLDGQSRAISFGFDARSDYRVESTRPAEPAPVREEGSQAGAQRFAVWHRGEKLGEFTTLLLGEKNLSNVAGAIALLHQLGFPAAAVAQAIAPFRGAARRQQLLYGDEQLRIYDDYGHHPSEIRATLQALRQLRPARLLVAFQPHRYTRTQHLLHEFATCFAGADRLWLTEIYPASEAPIPGVSAAVLAQAIQAQGQAVHYVPELAKLGTAVLGECRPGDLVLFLGAGDITKVAGELAVWCRQGWFWRSPPRGLEAGSDLGGGAAGSGTAAKPLMEAIVQ